jgi:hypothetical protein
MRDISSASRLKRSYTVGLELETDTAVSDQVVSRNIKSGAVCG